MRITVLASLLRPDDFGRFGIAMLALALVEALSQTGFEAALVQRDDEVEPYLSTVWTLQALRGCAIAMLLYVVAPTVAGFFDEPAATPLVRALGLNAVLLGFTNIGVVVFARELAFDRQFAYSLSGTLVDLVVSIAAAVSLRNAWALVFGLLAGSFVRLVVSHVLAPRVRPSFDRQLIAPLLRFGRWVWGTRIATFALGEGDDIFVGKLLGTDALGIYRMAYLYGNLPATEITQVVSTVSFPAYAKLQNDPERLREAFLRTLRVTLFVSVPAAIGIIVVAPDFVRIFLGGRDGNPWLPMVLPLQILTIWGLIRSLGASAGALLQGVGRPEVITKITYGKLLVLAAVIYPLTLRWGMPGTAAAVVLASLVSNPVSSYAAIKVAGCRVTDFFAALGYPLLAAAVMAAVVLAVHGIAGPDFGAAVFVASIVGGAGAYLAASLLVRALFGYDITRAFRATAP